MGVTLPEPLQVLLGLVGGAEWPEGDEDRMWELARVLRSAADALESAAPDVRRVHHETLAAYPAGKAYEAMDGTFLEIERFLPEVVESLRGWGRARGIPVARSSRRNSRSGARWLCWRWN